MVLPDKGTISPYQTPDRIQAQDRGKRSLLLDLRAAGAQQVFWRMVEMADIVLWYGSCRKT
jgi:crotonobetainyl-CoA:carnitine CoA-transferase CaiB-like acyl-CoA transferase